MALQPLLSGSDLKKFRTRHCERFVKLGRCHFGDKCQYSHDLEWTRRPLWKYEYGPQMCDDAHFSQDAEGVEQIVHRCPLRRRCQNAHTREEQMYHPVVYKKVLCEKWFRTKKSSSASGCNRYFCPFAHSEQELDLDNTSDLPTPQYITANANPSSSGQKKYVDLLKHIENNQSAVCPVAFKIDDQPAPELREKHLAIMHDKDKAGYGTSLIARPTATERPDYRNPTSNSNTATAVGFSANRNNDDDQLANEKLPMKDDDALTALQGFLAEKLSGQLHVKSKSENAPAVAAPTDNTPSSHPCDSSWIIVNSRWPNIVIYCSQVTNMPHMEMMADRRTYTGWIVPPEHLKSITSTTISDVALQRSYTPIQCIEILSDYERLLCEGQRILNLRTIFLDSTKHPLLGGWPEGISELIALSRNPSICRAGDDTISTKSQSVWVVSSNHPSLGCDRVPDTSKFHDLFTTCRALLRGLSLLHDTADVFHMAISPYSTKLELIDGVWTCRLSNAVDSTFHNAWLALMANIDQLKALVASDLKKIGKGSLPALRLDDPYALLQRICHQLNKFLSTPQWLVWSAPEIRQFLFSGGDEIASFFQRFPPTCIPTAADYWKLLDSIHVPTSQRGCAADVWALGSTLYHIGTGGRHPCGDFTTLLLPLSISSMGSEQPFISHEDVILPCSVNEELLSGPQLFCDLISQMLDPIPSRRPTAKEALTHPFFWNYSDICTFAESTISLLDGPPDSPPGCIANSSRFDYRTPTRCAQFTEDLRRSVIGALCRPIAWVDYLMDVDSVGSAITMYNSDSDLLRALIGGQIQAASLSKGPKAALFFRWFLDQQCGGLLNLVNYINKDGSIAQEARRRCIIYILKRFPQLPLLISATVKNMTAGDKLPESLNHHPSDSTTTCPTDNPSDSTSVTHMSPDGPSSVLVDPSCVMTEPHVADDAEADTLTKLLQTAANGNICEEQLRALVAELPRCCDENIIHQFQGLYRNGATDWGLKETTYGGFSWCTEFTDATELDTASDEHVDNIVTGSKSDLTEDQIIRALDDLVTL